MHQVHGKVQWDCPGIDRKADDWAVVLLVPYIVRWSLHAGKVRLRM